MIEPHLVENNRKRIFAVGDFLLLVDRIRLGVLVVQIHSAEDLREVIGHRLRPATAENISFHERFFITHDLILSPSSVYS